MKSRKSGLAETIISSKPRSVLFGIAAIALGLIFILMDYAPVTYDQAIIYTGTFAEYDARRNYKTLYFEDGSAYSIYPHTEDKAFRDKMKTLPVGTKLYLLVNPNEGLVVEVKTDTEELLNFDASQKAIDSYDNGYVFIGAFACAVGVYMIAYVIVRIVVDKTRCGTKKHTG